ncbi:MAG: hypothetical protein ACE5F7_07820 [Nitrospiria bacterium]
MKKIKKIFTAVCLAVISVLFLMTYTIIAKELPVLVDVSQLNEEYDGKRVTVMGWARSAEVKRGRLGSNFVETEVGENGLSVTVFSDFPPYNIVNNRVIVQGIYHHHGRYGGLLADHFIVADALMRDWG